MPIVTERYTLIAQAFESRATGFRYLGAASYSGVWDDSPVAIGRLLYVESNSPIGAPPYGLSSQVITLRYPSEVFFVFVQFSGLLYRGLVLNAFESGLGLNASGSLFPT